MQRWAHLRIKSPDETVKVEVPARTVEPSATQHASIIEPGRTDGVCATKTVNTHTFWAKYPYILRGMLSMYPLKLRGI